MVRVFIKNLIPNVGGQLREPLNFDLLSGDCLLIRGDSGVGKTSLLETISFLRKPFSGDVVFVRGDSENVNAECKIGYAPQDNVLYPSMTIRRQLELMAKFRKLPKKFRVKKVEELAERFGFFDKLDVLPDILSGGQKKRVVLARCLLGEPDVILLDEVFAGLNRSAADGLASVFLDEISSWNPILIVVEHESSRLTRYAEKCLTL